jgi:hypothetical protein
MDGTSAVELGAVQWAASTTITTNGFCFHGTLAPEQDFNKYTYTRFLRSFSDVAPKRKTDVGISPPV